MLLSQGGVNVSGLGDVYFFEDPDYPETQWTSGERARTLSTLNRLVRTGAIAALPGAGTIEHPLEFHRNPNLRDYSYTSGTPSGGRWQIDLHPDVFSSRGLTALSLGHEIGHVFGNQRGFPDKSLEERNIRAWEMQWGERLGARPELIQNSREWFIRCLQPCL